MVENMCNNGGIVVADLYNRGSCFLNTAGHNLIGFEQTGSCKYSLVCGKSATTPQGCLQEPFCFKGLCHG